MKKLKILLTILTCCMAVCVISPKVDVYAAPKMTLAQLREKFPHGKYWNHIGSNVNNPNGWTETACTHHKTTGCNINGSCGCNNVGQGWNAIQCMGFAFKLGYDAFGSNPGSSWTTVTGNNAKNYVLYNIKPGDVVRFNNDGHSMFVTGVSGNTITYAECNVQGTCIIRWDRTVTRANLNKTLTNVKIAPDTFKTNDFNISFSYNLLQGTGNFPVQTVKYTNTITIPDNALTRNGYTFNGFAGYRVQDKKYYTVEKGWQTQESINTNKYTKKVYPKGSSWSIGGAWTSTPAKQYSFIFAAIWTPVNVSVKYNANGGNGTYNQTYVIDNPIELPTESLMNKTGSVLKGFNFYRTQDQKYATYNGWATQEEIDANGYEKKVFDPGSAHTVNTSWTNDFSTQNTYEFIAVWEDQMPESITLNQTSITLNRGTTYSLTATVLPEDTKDKTVNWSSSDETVATVENGKVKALKAGTTTITVTTVNGKTVTAEVKVLKEFPFTDVVKGQWYYEYVDQAYQLGLMTGATDTLFKPTANMNRAMVAIVFHRMEGSEPVAYSKVFPDVANNQYYTTSVLWAKQTGIITGYNNGTFMPLKNVTREEMATMIQRFAKYKGLDVASSKDITYFKDYANISTYAKQPIQWCVENGLISGKLNGTKVDPLGTATRAECAKMLVQAFNLIYK